MRAKRGQESEKGSDTKNAPQKCEAPFGPFGFWCLTPFRVPFRVHKILPRQVPIKIMAEFTDAELAAFLDEALPPDRCSELEQELRGNDELRERLIRVRGIETAGLHSIGAIWRRARLSCPDREQLGQLVLGTLDQDHATYIRFHIDEIGCRYCQANLEDLQASAQASDQPTSRRQRYFQTSAGYLKK